MAKNRVRELRFHRGMTQDDVFILTRVWPSKLSKIERNILPPTDREKKLISRALGVDKEKAFPSNE